MGSHIENSAIKPFESNFTGIRVSKLQFITVKAVRKDKAVVFLQRGGSISCRKN